MFHVRAVAEGENKFMSSTISDDRMPEECVKLLWTACPRCCHRNACSYFCDHAFAESVFCAARQGKNAAHLLTAEAERLREAISRADDIRSLLSADETLERTLSRLLRREINSAEKFFGSC